MCNVLLAGSAAASLDRRGSWMGVSLASTSPNMSSCSSWCRMDDISIWMYLCNWLDEWWHYRLEKR